MNDIYDIKNTFLGFPINITNSLIFIIFIIWLFIYLKILFKKSELEDKLEEIVLIKKEAKNYADILIQFKKQYLESKSEIFYSKLIEILREILEEKENKNIVKMTFEEINTLDIENDLKNLIKDIYFKEYTKNVHDDTVEYRKELILKVKKIINRK